MAVCCWHAPLGDCPNHGIEAQTTETPVKGADVLVMPGGPHPAVNPWQGWEATYKFVAVTDKALAVDTAEVRLAALVAHEGYLGGGYALKVLGEYHNAGCKVAWAVANQCGV